MRFRLPKSVQLLALAGLVCPPLSAHVADSGFGDFRELSSSVPRSCSAEMPSPPPGWEALREQCAWSGRLQRQQWRWSGPARSSCVSPQAELWKWLQRVAPPAVPWERSWVHGSFRRTASGVEYMVSVRQAEGGGWIAEAWRWSPSPRAATRAWQSERWERIVKSQKPPAGGPRAPAPDRALATAWQRVLNGRVGELDGTSLLWQGAGGRCLRMETTGISQAQLRLPYSRDDARQEQRSAMQVQLARKFPNARWLSEFKLLPAHQSPSSGAKFIATWIEGDQVRGQLWMPTKDGGMVRARVLTALGKSPSDSSAASALLEDELTRLAAAWETLYE